MTAMTPSKTVLLFACVLVAACGSSGPTPDATPCDQKCTDGTALRGMRETMKLVFNLTFQGKPVGEHDYSFPCPLGGKARVFGTAQSNAIQGATEIDLTYELDACKLMQRDKEPSKNYDIVVSGTVKQKGIIAVQPSATTALGIDSSAMKIEGTVYDPPLPFNEAACPILFAQDGNRLTGTLCGRPVTIDL
jgi:hypothetical protein